MNQLENEQNETVSQEDFEIEVSGDNIDMSPEEKKKNGMDVVIPPMVMDADAPVPEGEMSNRMDLYPDVDKVDEKPEEKPRPSSLEEIMAE